VTETPAAPGRVLALDYGSARCGCAVSDPSGTLARPLEAIEAPDTDGGLQAIADLVVREQAQQVIVGIPVSLSGKEQEQAAQTRAFVKRLAERLDVPVTTHDERFTTRLAQATPGRSAEDSRAAAHLLTSYLDANRRT
jgi:putative Holliday junction resolvase